MSTETDIGTVIPGGENVSLSAEERGSHTLLVSATGGGKTTLLYALCRQDLLGPSGFICVDFAGNLYADLVKLCARLGLEDRVILIDPTDPQYSVGLNYLELLPGTEPAALTQMAMTGITRVYHEDDAAVKPLWEVFAPASPTFVTRPTPHSGSRFYGRFAIRIF